MDTKTKSELISFDMADLLDSKAVMAEYLSQVLADGDTDELLGALGHIAKARGMSQIAADAGLGRESLYKALRDNAQPRYDTVNTVLHALRNPGVHVPRNHRSPSPEYASAGGLRAQP